MSSAEPVATEQVVVALPQGVVSFLGVAPNRAGLVGVLSFGSLDQLIAWFILRRLSLPGTDS